MSPVARLEDVFSIRDHVKEQRSKAGTPPATSGSSAAQSASDSTAVMPGAVQAFEWVVWQPSLLAVLVAPALLLLWDTKGTWLCDVGFDVGFDV